MCLARDKPFSLRGLRGGILEPDCLGSNSESASNWLVTSSTVYYSLNVRARSPPASYIGILTPKDGIRRRGFEEGLYVTRAEPS